jgi:hypothetical protein
METRTVLLKCALAFTLLPEKVLCGGESLRGWRSYRRAALLRGKCKH